MFDASGIESLLLFALFFAVVSSYAYLLFVRRRRISCFVNLPYRAKNTFNQKDHFMLSEKASSPVNQHDGGRAGRGPARGRLSAAGDWLVPVIVWLLVTMMAMAIVSFLLGGR